MWLRFCCGLGFLAGTDRFGVIADAATAAETTAGINEKVRGANLTVIEYSADKVCLTDGWVFEINFKFDLPTAVANPDLSYAVGRSFA